MRTTRTDYDTDGVYPAHRRSARLLAPRCCIPRSVSRSCSRRARDPSVAPVRRVRSPAQGHAARHGDRDPRLLPVHPRASAIGIRMDDAELGDRIGGYTETDELGANDRAREQGVRWRVGLPGDRDTTTSATSSASRTRRPRCWRRCRRERCSTGSVARSVRSDRIARRPSSPTRCSRPPRSIRMATRAMSTAMATVG